MGIRAPKAMQVAGVPSNPAPIQAASGPIPAMPSSYSASGTAPMASGETATPESLREMRIPGDPVSPASLPSTGAARGTAPAVNIGNPEPIQTSTTANSSVTPITPASGGLGTPVASSPSPGGSAANIRSYEDAQKYLKQHGVTWQRMSGDGDDWQFSCGIPNPSNPHINKTYQTSRPFPDLLSALRAVIAQIEQSPH